MTYGSQLDHPNGPSEAAISRRAFARTGLGGGLVGALLATADRRHVRAQATPAADADAGRDTSAENSEPGRYVLTGDATEIVFLPSIAGRPARLNYRDATLSLGFAGEELAIETNGALGRLVWVAIDYAPDACVRYLTLLVPEVNPVAAGDDVPVGALAILTTHWTSIGGPEMVEGALQSYEVVALEGVAEFAPTAGG